MDIFNFWFNPSKRVKKYLKSEIKKGEVMVELRRKTKKPIPEGAKIVSYRSVFIKFLLSTLLFLSTIFLMFVFFHNYQRTQASFQAINQQLINFKLNNLSKAMNPGDHFKGVSEFIIGVWLVFTLFSVFTYIFTFYRFPSALKCTHWLFVLWLGSMMGFILINLTKK